MKRVKILVASIALVGAALAGTVALQNHSAVDMHFLRNAEALAQSEGHTIGGCEKKEGDCIGVCCGCGQFVYAPNILGPAYNIQCCQ